MARDARVMSGAAVLAIIMASPAIAADGPGDGTMAVAQANAPNPAAAGSGTIRPSPGDVTTIGAIVVTAEHRAEDIQNVPIAITAITGAALQAQGVTGFEDLSTAIPSLRFGTGVTGGENVITMRGLGSQNTTPGGDSPVAYNVDGVYLQQTTAVDPEFYDIDRIEVLRGPQGTLYGRNSVGGSINLVTRKPTDDFETSVDALYGNYDARIFRGFISGPIFNANGIEVEARLTAVSANHDPYATNLSTAPGATYNQDGQNYWMVRGQLLFKFGDTARLLLMATTSENKDPTATNTAWWETPARYIDPPGGLPANSPCNFSTEASFNPRVFCHDYPENADNRQQLYSATFDWRLPFATFTSVTAYAQGNVNQTSDGDGSDLPIAYDPVWNMRNEQFSEEVRLASLDTSSAVKWLAGFIYFYADDYEDYAYLDTGYNDVFPFPGELDEFAFLSHGYTKTKSFAPFGQVDVNLDRTALHIPLTVTAGLRYTNDTKYGFNYLNYELPVACGGSCEVTTGPFSQNWSQVTGKFELAYQVNSNTLTYASVSRGYLAGGNIIGLAHVYGPETMWSYEVGLKSRFLDDHVQIDLAGYHEAIQNLQVFVQSSTESGINNVNGTTGVNGLEAEFAVVPVANLRLNATVTLTDAHYGEYITTDTRFGGPGPGCSPTTLLCNFQGNELNQTPPYTVDFGAGYTFHIANGTITPRVDTFFSGHVQFLPDNYFTSTQPAYHFTNVHVAWLSANGRWQIEAFAKNLENANVISNDGLQSISLGQQVLEPDNFTYYPPRTFGVRFTASFGGPAG
jgi:iron complex outermembrane recepter protein